MELVVVSQRDLVLVDRRVRTLVVERQNRDSAELGKRIVVLRLVHHVRERTAPRVPSHIVVVRQC
ncbi:MAG TPA: hypothetical protein PKC74_01360, partial [Turneriella sp.]|nr:hypothetical protein [Turneriella sp.]